MSAGPFSNSFYHFPACCTSLCHHHTPPSVYGECQW
jgi:hypothetical protein